MNTSGLSWTFSWPGALFGGLILLVFLGFSFANLRRASFRSWLLLPELLRLTIIIMILFTLTQPEWVRRIDLSRDPELVILHDRSGSMATVDIAGPGTPPISRQDWVDLKLADGFYRILEKDYRIRILSFPADREAGTDISRALQDLTGRGENLRAVILMSDGDWNTGSEPAVPAIALRNEGVRVFSIAVGSSRFLPDVHVKDVKAPVFCIAREKAAIPFVVLNHLDRELNAEIELFAGDTVEARKRIRVPAHAEIGESIVWKATRSGTQHLTLRLPVEKDEQYEDNNAVSFDINVRTELLRVLVIDSRPRWEYRFLRNALHRDPGVEVNCLLLHPDMTPGEGEGYLSAFPESREALAAHDVVFIGDVGIGEGELTGDQAELLKGLIRNQGSGLVFMPGIRGRHLTLADSALGELYPVVLDPARPEGMGVNAESRLRLTEYGRGHLLTMLADTPAANSQLWDRLPGFYWNAAVERAKTGTQVLAVHNAMRNTWGRLPLLVTKPFGSGNVLFMGSDSAWRWRRGVEDRYHYRFWGQVVRWMAHKRHMAHDRRIRLFYSPEQPVSGDTVFMQATVLDMAGFPVEGASVSMEIRCGEDVLQQFGLEPEGEGWGVYAGRFKPPHSGNYDLRIVCPDEDISFQAGLTVQPRVLERQGQPARGAPLRDVARITRGAFFSTADLETAVQAIQDLPARETVEKRFRLWCQWWWGCSIVMLLAAYWVSRKMIGLI